MNTAITISEINNDIKAINFISGIRNEYIFGVNSLLNVKISLIPDLWHCQQIADMIKKENLKKQHMVEKTPEALVKELELGIGCLAIVDNKAVWYLWATQYTLSNWQNVYEVGSMMVHESYRKIGIAKFLAEQIFWQLADKPVYAVTEIPSVKHINYAVGLQTVIEEVLSKELHDLIVWIAPLSEEDEIFWNTTFLASL